MALVQNKVVSYSEAKSMVGNRWPLPTQGLWLVAWLSSVELRCELTTLHKPPSEIVELVDDDSEDEVGTVKCEVQAGSDQESRAPSTPCAKSPWKSPKRKAHSVTHRRVWPRLAPRTASAIDSVDGPWESI